MKDIKVLGIDLAKNVFQLHGTDAKGKCILRKRLSRDKLVEFVAQINPCIIGIEACMSAHYWARVFQNMGHTVKMMSPQFVKPYVMSNKNDRNDAQRIAEAVTRPGMKFVSIKNIEQQDILLLHRARELALKQRTAQANQIRGLLMEYGIIISITLPDTHKTCSLNENIIGYGQTKGGSYRPHGDDDWNRSATKFCRNAFSRAGITPERIEMALKKLAGDSAAQTYLSTATLPRRHF